MTTLLPTSQSTSVEAYEDMFKEITRKLYGDESAHGLYPHNTQVAQLAPAGTPSAPESGERSFTTLVSDRSLAQLDYDAGVESFKTEDHLTTAFGLAALMQNGFPPPGAILNPVNFNVGSGSKLNTSSSANTEERWQQTEDALPWNNNRSSSYTAPQKHYKLKPKQEPVSNNAESNNNVNASPALPKQQSLSNLTNPGPKRYNCLSCQYSTDRRDLFTRHENIHKEEKPFHCYACLKQFNRADHVKKHFLRMHREMAYDINKTRKNPPRNYYSNSQSTPNQSQQIAQTNYSSPVQTAATTIQHQPHSLPQAAASQQTLQNQQNNGSVLNMSTINGIAIMQHNSTSLPNNVTIKSEKLDKSPKKKGEKRFMCCYCSWTGADNWGLKRHLNTHTKPYVCLLCDYKAARSERLATHVFKVHNKKACNKCTFFADDQNQLAAHQLEAHSHESRQASRPVVSSVILGSTNIGNSTATSTGNILRTLQNTFVPNASLVNIQNNVNQVFGSMSSSSASNYTANSTPNTASNLISNLNHHLTTNAASTNHWRSVTISSSSGSVQKHGAERLFAYFEADGSDPEDYNRQLAMQALSRNTASVAQDFPKREVILYDMITTKLIEQQGKLSPPPKVAALTAATWSAPQVEQKAMSTTIKRSLDSPPAAWPTSPITQVFTPSGKRRRKSSDNDKENDDQCAPPKFATTSPLQSKTSVEQRQNVFDKLYQRSIQTFIQQIGGGENIVQQMNEKERQQFNASLIEFLQNNPELTVSPIVSTATGSGLINELQRAVSAAAVAPSPPHLLVPPQAAVTEKRNRKQSQPRKIAKPDEDLLPAVASIRDKHLIRLIAAGKSCRLCKDDCSYHSVSSLLLHNLWRHSQLIECSMCGAQFQKSYKLLLHLRLDHRIQLRREGGRRRWYQ